MVKKSKSKLNLQVIRSAAVNQYYVYDPAFREIGGTNVIDNSDGTRVIRLNAVQAQYLIDQGVIGLVPHDDLSEVSQNARRMFRGEMA